METINPGDKVFHPLFGSGVVAEIRGSGTDARITVDFASNVGRKTLLAGVAKLKLTGPEAHCEAVTWGWRPRHGRRIEIDDVHALIRAEARKPQFWSAVRELLRVRKRVPKIVDDPDGKVSVTPTGLLRVEVRAKQEPGELACAAAVLACLEPVVQRDFERIILGDTEHAVPELDAENLVHIEEPDLGALPDRAPRGRPKKVQPKGKIRSMPKRRDDY